MIKENYESPSALLIQVNCEFTFLALSGQYQSTIEDYLEDDDMVM